jgi:site-specific recombinase XerD
MSIIKVSEEIKKELERFKRYMLENEYTQKTAFSYATYLSRYLRWAEGKVTQDLRVSIVNFLNVEQEVAPRVFKECRASLKLYFKMSVNESLRISMKNEVSPETNEVAQSFYDYSVKIKRMQPSSAEWETVRVKHFLEYISDRFNYPHKTITAHEIRDYVITCLSHLKDSSKGREVTAIRNFFRFHKFNGIPVHESVFLLPLSPAVWKNAAFPTTIDESIFSSLHEIYDKDTEADKRNRCIVLCFTELALRCTEVASLTIDAFDWRAGTVTIRNTKNHVERKLPTSDKLIQAVIDYLKTSRPKTSSRVLFVRFKHKCGEPMECGQIRRIVKETYGKANTGIKATGTHILRRTAATKIYNSGNSLKMTADILGHMSLESTTHYTKADMVNLQKVVSPWPIVTTEAGAHDDI